MNADVARKIGWCSDGECGNCLSRFDNQYTVDDLLSWFRSNGPDECYPDITDEYRKHPDGTEEYVFIVTGGDWNWNSPLYPSGIYSGVASTLLEALEQAVLAVSS